MINYATTKQLETTPNLTIVRKEKKTNVPAKLVNLKKSGDKNPVMLPPQPEMYIKAKKHDFF